MKKILEDSISRHHSVVEIKLRDTHPEVVSDQNKNCLVRDTTRKIASMMMKHAERTLFLRQLIDRGEVPSQAEMSTLLNGRVLEVIRMDPTDPSQPWESEFYKLRTQHGLIFTVNGS